MNATTQQTPKRPKVRKVCATCGSDDVKADAYAEWDQEHQRWEVIDAFDKGAFCFDCDGECRIEDREIGATGVNLYAIEIKVCATAYVKAKSAAEARDIARERFAPDQGGLHVHADADIISGLDYDDPDLPDISVSPEMTFHGMWSERETVDLVEGDV